MPNQDSTFRIAVIATVYFPNSHADVIASRWVEPRPDDPDWGWPAPRTSICTMFVEQFDEKDMARDICAKHGIELHDSVDAALCNGGSRLAVDGVLLIGEHGEYACNTIGQKLYPRKELFDQITARFRNDGRAVPIFCDKHLSWNFNWAREMDACADELGFMLISSSSVPLCRYAPDVDLAGHQAIEEAVIFFFGDEEAYGYHGFEFGQAILERRAGGETGVNAVTVYRSDDVWRYLNEEVWSQALMVAAEAAIREQSPKKVKDGDMRENCSNGDLPTAIVVEYRDGLRATYLNLSGHASNWGMAMRTTDGQMIATAPVVDDHAHFHAHFATMSRIVEDAFLSGKRPFAPQRSLITAGLTARYMEARAASGVKLPTPELAIAYQPLPRASCFRFDDR